MNAKAAAERRAEEQLDLLLRRYPLLETLRPDIEWACQLLCDCYEERVCRGTPGTENRVQLP